MHLPTINAAVAASILSFVMYTDAFWRMGCQSSTGYARIDPLVSPGAVGSHMHSIFGSSGFSESSNYDALRAGSCTSCTVEQDRSAYWHPALYFKSDADGTYTAVNQKGGMLAYYLLYGDNITAFPATFAMIAGDTFERSFNLPIPDPPLSEWSSDPQQSSQASLRQKALGFNCLNYAITPEGSLYRHFMPDKAYLDANCPDGLRFELMFPSCWNEAAGPTSHNYKDHMAYPDLVKTGNCPNGFSTRVPSLFYEIIYDTYAFNGKAGQFILANGDPTGFGYHGDFITGWDVPFLQSAIDTCTNPSGEMSDCPLFTLQDPSVSSACHFSIPDNLKSDNPMSPGAQLPGGVQVVASGGVDGPTAAPASSQVAVPTLSYSAGASTNIAGGIFAAASDSYSAPPPPSSSPPAPAPTSTTPPPPPPPSPTPTPAPATANALLPGESIVSTMYSTLADSNAVLELVMVELEVTVYVSTTTTALATVTGAETKRRKGRRHVHAHAHKGALGGGLV